MCYVSPLEIDSSRSRKRITGDKAGAPIEIQHIKKRAYRRQIRLIHRSFQTNFCGENSPIFFYSVSVFFPSLRGREREGENSVGMPVPADSGASVAAVRPDYDGGDGGVKLTIIRRAASCLFFQSKAEFRGQMTQVIFNWNISKSAFLFIKNNYMYIDWNLKSIQLHLQLQFYVKHVQFKVVRATSRFYFGSQTQFEFPV